MYDSPEKLAGRHPSKKVRVWGKGQFTIPAEIRAALGIGENSIFDVYQVGNAIIATPEKLLVKELAEDFMKEMKSKNLGLKELLTELREGSHQYETD